MRIPCTTPRPAPRRRSGCCPDPTRRRYRDRWVRQDDVMTVKWPFFIGIWWDLYGIYMGFMGLFHPYSWWYMVNFRGNNRWFLGSVAIMIMFIIITGVPMIQVHMMMFIMCMIICSWCMVSSDKRGMYPMNGHFIIGIMIIFRIGVSKFQLKPIISKNYVGNQWLYVYRKELSWFPWISEHKRFGSWEMIVAS